MIIASFQEEEEEYITVHSSNALNIKLQGERGYTRSARFVNFCIIRQNRLKFN